MGLAKILIVDDHPVMRFGLASAIKRERGFAVCGEAEAVTDALALVEKLRPNLVIADLQLKQSSGLELISGLRVTHPTLPILVMSSSDEVLHAEAALNAGARGYLSKDAGLVNLIPAIKRILAGDIYVSERVQEHLMQRKIMPNLRKSDMALTAKELAVLRLIGEWKTEGEIQHQLNIGPGTVWYYRCQLRKKLGLRSGNDLIRYATDWAKKQH